jgi:hypothetical protein
MLHSAVSGPQSARQVVSRSIAESRWLTAPIPGDRFPDGRVFRWPWWVKHGVLEKVALGKNKK